MTKKAQAFALSGELARIDSINDAFMMCIIYSLLYCNAKLIKK